MPNPVSAVLRGFYALGARKKILVSGAKLGAGVEKALQGNYATRQANYLRLIKKFADEAAAAKQAGAPYVAKRPAHEPRTVSQTLGKAFQILHGSEPLAVLRGKKPGRPGHLIAPPGYRMKFQEVKRWESLHPAFPTHQGTYAPNKTGKGLRYQWSPELKANDASVTRGYFDYEHRDAARRAVKINRPFRNIARVNAKLFSGKALGRVAGSPLVWGAGAIEALELTSRAFHEHDVTSQKRQAGKVRRQRQISREKLAVDRYVARQQREQQKATLAVAAATRQSARIKMGLPLRGRPRKAA